MISRFENDVNRNGNNAILKNGKIYDEKNFKSAQRLITGNFKENTVHRTPFFRLSVTVITKFRTDGPHKCN